VLEGRVDSLVYPFYLVALGMFGLIFGSFANVVIWRVPRRESVVSPGSHCPKCGRPIRGYDNIPVLSWLLLGAKCRDCGAPISWRYPLVEAVSGVAWLSAGIVFGLRPQALVAVALFYLLLILACIDLDVMRLPNVLVAIVAAIGLAAAVISQLTGVPLAPLTPPATAGPLSQPLVFALTGVLVGGGFVALVNGAYSGVRRRRGFGMGDVKLAAAAGLYLGPYVLLALMFGSLLAVVGGVALTAGRGEGPVAQRRFPFGPFLAGGIVAAALAGPALLAWYVLTVRL
jgi:leader peptidase (prepilin peptidase)/N-methyltransferase